MQIDEEKKAEIIGPMSEMWLRGHASRALGSRFGISPATVRRWLAEAGVDMGGAGRKVQITSEYINLAAKLRKEGMKWIEISDKIGFSVRQLQRHLYGK